MIACQGQLSVAYTGSLWPTCSVQADQHTEVVTDTYCHMLGDSIHLHYVCRHPRKLDRRRRYGFHATVEIVPAVVHNQAVHEVGGPCNCPWSIRYRQEDTAHSEVAGNEMMVLLSLVESTLISLRLHEATLPRKSAT